MKIVSIKNKKNLICFLLCVVIGIIIFTIFKIEMKSEIIENENVDLSQCEEKLKVPDRIIYKNKKNEYIIIEPGTSEYKQIYYELCNRIETTTDGKVYSKNEIREMQNEGCFIELDYNTASKNFVFMLNGKNVGIIKRFSDSGQVIQTGIQDAEELIKKLDIMTSESDKKYSFVEPINITSENKISRVTDNLNLENTKVAGVYKKVIQEDNNEYNNMLKTLNFKAQELPKINFNKQNAIIVVSKFEIKEIETNIGNIKYKLGNFLDEYIVNILIVGKIPNTNCIYYEFESKDLNVSEFTSNTDKNGVEYYVQNEKYYTNIEHKKIELISLDEAIRIAENEAKKEKYQYQGWKSEFYSKINEDDTISCELILGPEDMKSSTHFWTEKWKQKPYEGKLIWVVRLFDKNDPLTNLFVYVDAIDGNIIGAGAASD